MKIQAALGRSSRPLSLNAIRLVKPSSQRSLTARLGCSIGVAYLNSSINNNYATITSSILLDKAFDSKLTDVITAFDTIASRIPVTMAKSVNANKAFYDGVKKNSGMYGIPSDVISRLLLAYGQDADKLSYYLTGALAALSTHTVLSSAMSGALTEVGLDSLMDSLGTHNTVYFEESQTGDRINDSLTNRLDVQINAHLENLRGVILSVLEDYMAGIIIPFREDRVGAIMGASDEAATMKNALIECDKQIWFYFATMAGRARELAKSIKQDRLESITTRLPWDARGILGYTDEEVVDGFNSASMVVAEGDTAEPVSNYSLKGSLSDPQAGPQDYKSQGFAAVSAYIEVASSQKNQEDVLKSLGIDQSKMNKVIAQLFDVASVLSRGNSITNIISRGLRGTVNSNHVIVQSYVNLLTAMLGATEDGARILVADFLTSAAWNDSLASVFYKHAAAGTSVKTSDLGDKFNALTLSKDGLMSSFKAGAVELSIAKDQMSMGTNSDGSSSRVSIIGFGNPFDDAFFRYDVTERRKSVANETEPIIFTSGNASSNALFSLIDVINSSVSSMTQFITKGDIGQFDLDTVAVADALLGSTIVNYLSDGVKMRQVGRNSSLRIGVDYTISQDARKSVIDLLGVIDASIAASIEVVGSCVVKGAAARIAPALDILKGLSDINKQRTEISKVTSYYLPGDDEVDTVLADTMSKVSNVVSEVFGITIDGNLPDGTKDTSISVTVPAGVDVSMRDMLRVYTDLLGSFEAKKKFTDAKRKIISSFDRFQIQKKNDAVNIKMGNSAYALLWNDIKKNDYDQYSSNLVESNFANIVSSSMLMDKLKNGSISALTTRGPEELRMTGIMPLSYIKDRSPRKLITIGLDSDLRMVSNMFRFVEANAVHGISDKQQAVGKLLSLVTVASDIQKFSITGAIIANLVSVDNAINGSAAFSVINPLDSIVRLGSISATNFASLDLRTFYGSSGDDLLYNILDSIGIYPLSKLSYASAQVLLTYNAIRSDDYKYPFVNRVSVDSISPGEEYTYMDLLDISIDRIRREESLITSHYSCSVFIWGEGRDRQEASIEIFDVGEKRPIVIADSETVDLSQVDNNIELCVEATVDLPFGQKIVSGLSEQMLLGMANKMESLF